MNENEMEATREANDPSAVTDGRVSRSQFMRLSSWFTLGMCLAAAFLPLAAGRPGIWSALKVAGLFSWHTALSSVLGLVIGVIVATLINSWRPLQVIAKRMAELVAWETFRAVDYVVIAFSAALGEELLFRGALQSLIGLIPVAIIFGLLHATAVAHVALAGVLGLWLGWLYEWSGNLWSPIAAHMAVDLITGVFLARTMRPGLSSVWGD